MTACLEKLELEEMQTSVWPYIKHFLANFLIRKTKTVKQYPDKISVVTFMFRDENKHTPPESIGKFEACRKRLRLLNQNRNKSEVIQ